VIAGVFVGGAGTRMGGRAKGLLRAPDGSPIVERWHTILGALGVEMFLVGTSDAYAHLGLEVVADSPGGIGPLGGLIALLRRAGAKPALALACDMPFVSPALVQRLMRAEPAPVVAPRRDGRWEPLLARYEPSAVLALALSRVGARDHSLQSLLEAAGAVELPLIGQEADELRDWDAPEDLSLAGVAFRFAQ